MTTKREWLEQVYRRSKELPLRFSTISDMELEPLYTPEDVKGSYEEALGYPGEIAVHPRRLRLDVSRAAVDYAPVRRFRPGGGH